jgi:homoserine kinase
VDSTGAARPARVRVPASTSNLGAGFDCLGLALDFYLEASYTPDSGSLRLERAGTLAELTGPDLLIETFRASLERRGFADTGLVRATSEIPIGRGLGSSASATVAGLALGAAVAGEMLDAAEALAIAAEREGHPDNAAPALLGGLVGVVHGPTGQPIALRLQLSSDIAFAWAAPAAQVGTAQARAALPETVSHAAAARALSRNLALVQGLASANAELIQAGFGDELHVPYRLPLIPGGADAMRAAERAGAWAVTISGSGSGLIAVCPPGREDAVAEAMGASFRATGGEAGVIARPVRIDPEGVQILPP